MVGSVTRPSVSSSYLTVTEVSEMMRVSTMTVYRLIHAGNMRAIRVGRSFRVPIDAVDEYVSSLASNPQALKAGGLSNADDSLDDRATRSVG